MVRVGSTCRSVRAGRRHRRRRKLFQAEHRGHRARARDAGVGVLAADAHAVLRAVHVGLEALAVLLLTARSSAVAPLEVSWFFQIFIEGLALTVL